MRILFIYNGTESLGIEYISALLKSKGHEVYLFFDPQIFGGHLIQNETMVKLLSLDKEIIRNTVNLKPDLVAFSAHTSNYRWCLKIAENVKRLMNIPIVFGGVHTSALPKTVLSNECVDFAIIGEGEFSMLDLVEHLKNSINRSELLNIENICFRYNGTIHINNPRPYIRDLDLLPFPDKALFYNKVPFLERNYLIMASRGCLYSCTYCVNNWNIRLYCKETIHVRRRSVGNIIEELSRVKKRNRTRFIVFVDDVFTFSSEWLEGFVEEYRSKINMPFFCNVHPQTITKKTISLLKKMGCCLITMGIQSGSERIRRDIFHRPGSNQKIIEAVSFIKESGIKISVDNIFGAPTETEDDVKETLDLCYKIKPDRIIIFWLTAYPKTKIVEYLKKERMLTDNDIKKIEEGYVGSYHHTGSIKNDRMPLYIKYELLFYLCAFIHNDKLYSLISRFLAFFPFKRIISRLVILINAIKNKDPRFFYFLGYLLAKKKIP